MVQEKKGRRPDLDLDAQALAALEAARAGPSHVSRRWRERCSERGSARWCLPEMVKRRFKKSFERWLRGFFVHWHKCEVPTGPEIIRLCPTSALLNYLPSIL